MKNSYVTQNSLNARNQHESGNHTRRRSYSVNYVSKMNRKPRNRNIHDWRQKEPLKDPPPYHKNQTVPEGHHHTYQPQQRYHQQQQYYHPQQRYQNQETQNTIMEKQKRTQYRYGGGLQQTTKWKEEEPNMSFSYPPPPRGLILETTPKTTQSYQENQFYTSAAQEERYQQYANMPKAPHHHQIQDNTIGTYEDDEDEQETFGTMKYQQNTLQFAMDA